MGATVEAYSATVECSWCDNNSLSLGEAISLILSGYRLFLAGFFRLSGEALLLKCLDSTGRHQ